MIRIALELFRILQRVIIMRLESASHLSAPAYGAVLQVILDLPEFALNITQNGSLTTKIDRFDEKLHAKIQKMQKFEKFRI